MATAEINGTTLYHETRGEGEPLLLVQGMSGHHDSWGEPFLAALEAQGLQTLRYDHRGIGRSAPWREPFTLVDLAADALALLDAVGWETAHVLGISMGGMVAQELALAAPERVRTLTLGCTYAGGPEGQLVAPEDMQGLSEAMMSGDRERAIRASYAINLSPAFTADEAHYQPFQAMAMRVPVAMEVIMLQVQAIGGHDTSARLAAIDAPTLVIHGDADRMLPVANGRFIAAHVPGATLDVLPGVGHMFWWERPEESAAAIGDLVRSGAAAGRVAPG